MSQFCASCDTSLPPEAKFCLNCGAATPTETGHRTNTTAPGDEWLIRLQSALEERYRIERVLGQGGMATVYLAHDLKHDRQVAVKVLRPELQLAASRFLNEIKVTAKLQHPNLLPVHDSGEVDSLLYYVMPFVDGESLRDRIARDGALPILEVVHIVREVTDALGYAHRHGVVHRDIKPGNVLVSGRHAIVTDFGIYKAVSESAGAELLTTGIVLGTPAYMAPEQVASDLIDHRVDIYSVGVMTYELITGQPPFVSNTAQEVLAAHLTKVPEPVSTHRVQVPPMLEDLIMKCLEKRVGDRLQSADEIARILDKIGTRLRMHAGLHVVPGHVGTRGTTVLSPRHGDVDIWAISHPGRVLKENHDHFVLGSICRGLVVDMTAPNLDIEPILEPNRLASFGVVADGVPRTRAAETAARLAVQELIQEVSRRFHDALPTESTDTHALAHLLLDAAFACHNSLLEPVEPGSESVRLAKSVQLFLGVWPQAYLLQMGHSRSYMFRDRHLTAISPDHMSADDLHDRGDLKQIRASEAQWSQVLSNLSEGEQVVPVVTRIVRDWGTVIMMCSDGLTKHVSDERIRHHMLNITSCYQLCRDLLTDALDDGGTDNISIVVGRTIKPQT